MPERALNRRGEQIAAQREEIAARHADAAQALAAGARAKGALTSTFLAVQRQGSALALLDYRHGRQGRRDEAVAAEFAPVVFAGLMWELRGNAAVAKADRPKVAVRELRIILPGLPMETARRLARLSEAEARMSNEDAGHALGFTWAEYAALRRIGAALYGRGRALQLAPCDISGEEFRKRRAALNRELDAERKAAARRKAGRRSADDRAAADAAQREALDRLAADHGVTVRTIRRWISTGRIAPPGGCHSAVREKVIEYRSDTKMTGSGSAPARSDGLRDKPPRKGARGGLKPPPRPVPSRAAVDPENLIELNEEGRDGASSPEPARLSSDRANDQKSHRDTFDTTAGISFQQPSGPFLIALEAMRSGPLVLRALHENTASAVRRYAGGRG